MTRNRVLFPVVSLCLILLASPATAACVNKYVAQKSNESRYTFTLLTGMFTFDEAKKLAADIASGAHAPLAWVAEDGKPIAKQFGALKVVRPMPVACEGKPSGVVLQAVFVTMKPPTGTVRIVFEPDLTIAFEAQN